MGFEEIPVDETSIFLCPTPLPTHGPNGPLELSGIICIFHLRSNDTQYNLTLTWWFHFWIWRRCLKFIVLALRGPPPGPHGGHEYHLKTSNPLALRMNSAKFEWNPNMRFEEADETVTFYIKPPPQPVTPLRGQWGHPGSCHEQLKIHHHKANKKKLLCCPHPTKI